MSLRKRLTRRGSRKYFTATAKKTNVRNIPGKVVQLGGTRL